MSYDDFGQPVYGPPQVLRAHWMSRLSEQTQSSGTQFSVVHSVVLDQVVEAGGKMAKTESIDDAQEVVAVEVSYGLRSRDVVVTATLT